MSDPRRSWTWRHAVAKSALPPTTRHVLLTISLHMNDVGEGCYPTTAQLALESGRSERCVCEHIQVAIEAGWIEVSKHGFAGQKWARNEYRPRWPDPTPNPVDETPQDDDGGTDAASAPSPEKALTQDQYLQKGTDAASVEGTDIDDKKALTQRQSYSSIETSTPSHSQGDEGEGEIQLGFSRMWPLDAQAAIRDMAANPVTSHIVENFLAEVCGTLNPPADVDPPSYVRQLRKKLRDAVPDDLRRLATRMIDGRGRDLPTIGELAKALASIAAAREHDEHLRAIGTARATPGPSNRKPVMVERGMVPWAVWMQKLSDDERAGAERVGKILVTDLWPSKPSARFVGLAEGEARS
jgi:hypothetical protein